MRHRHSSCALQRLELFLQALPKAVTGAGHENDRTDKAVHRGGALFRWRHRIHTIDCRSASAAVNGTLRAEQAKGNYTDLQMVISSAVREAG